MTKLQLSSISLAFLSVFLLLGACSDKPVDTFASASMVNQLEKTQTLLHTNRSVPGDAKELPSFDLLYEGDIEVLLADNEAIDQLMEEYALEIIHSFEIDEIYKGITLQARAPLVDPIQVGKMLSLVDQVLMIEVNNLEKDPLNDYL